MVEEALRGLYKSVQEKTNILRSDRLNLARQYGELRFLNDYLEYQVDISDPVEFIRMSQAHQVLLDDLCKKTTQTNEIDISIDVNDYLCLTQTKQKTLLNEKTEKVEVQKPKENKSNLHFGLGTTKNRKRLFASRTSFLPQHHGPGSLELSSKIPHIPNQLNPGVFNRTFDKANVISYCHKNGIEPQHSGSSEVQEKMTKMFKLIEEKTKEMVSQSDVAS